MKTFWTKEELLQALNTTNTPYTLVDLIKEKLVGFEEIKGEWHLLPNKGYYLVKDDATIIAWRMPSDFSSKQKIKLLPWRILAAHTDSPCLKLKPNSLYSKSYQGKKYLSLATEPYGSPILNSWFNREITLEGRVWVETENEIQLSDNFKWVNCGLIPQPSKHLTSKELEAKSINTHEELNIFLGIKAHQNASVDLWDLLCANGTFSKGKPNGRLLAHDLHCISGTPAAISGIERDLIAYHRLDNVSSALAILEAFGNTQSAVDHLQMIALFDHEEIGSETSRGAGSALLPEILKKILECSGADFLLSAQASTVVSVDVAHAQHPNHSFLSDERHPCLIGGGVICKQHPNHRYATEAAGKAWLEGCSKRVLLANSLQTYSHRNDLPCGSTIGPILAAKLCCTTLDIGLPLLSMHSHREIISWNDYVDLRTVLGAVLK